MQAPTESYKSHYETYKGWGVSVQISAHLSRIDAGRDAPDYIPRVIVTEHEGFNFKDKEVADGGSYPTPKQCIEHGIRSAHAYIDRQDKPSKS
ncbi:hypothetical protein [Herminiimonas aquatilis]|uniref:Uncharacterized protein n=1 Tax=Herminiimonas aquatilis TaxID=345342 RepID=A0ABW2J8E6_9BURK